MKFTHNEAAAAEGTFEVDGLTREDRNTAFKIATAAFKNDKEGTEKIFNIQSGRIVERMVATGLVLMLMDYVNSIERKLHEGTSKE